MNPAFAEAHASGGAGADKDSVRAAVAEFGWPAVEAEVRHLRAERQAAIERAHNILHEWAKSDQAPRWVKELVTETCDA